MFDRKQLRGCDETYEKERQRKFAVLLSNTIGYGVSEMNEREAVPHRAQLKSTNQHKRRKKLLKTFSLHGLIQRYRIGEPL